MELKNYIIEARCFYTSGNIEDTFDFEFKHELEPGELASANELVIDRATGEAASHLFKMGITEIHYLHVFINTDTVGLV